MTTIKLHVPKDLPEDSLSAVAFEAWQNQTISFLEQELCNHDFTSGIYSEWKPKETAENGRRISSLSEADPDKKVIDAKVGPTVADKAAEKATLLTKRNAQLTKFLQLIANMCQYSEQSDILGCSTSLTWIWDYLKKHYNIESRGSHILDVAALNPKPDQKPIVFYKQFRASVANNLRKRGDTVAHKGGRKLQEDETISSTFECMIMMWSLEKIDKRLPAKVKKDFGFRMEGETTLFDLQTAIFQAVPAMIEELDDNADIRAAYVYNDDEETSLAAFGPGGSRGSYRGRGRGGFRRPGRGQTGRADSGKMCRVCRLAGKNETVYRSHNVGSCYFFNRQERADLITGLNTLQLDENDTGADSPFYDMEEEIGQLDD